MEWLARHRWVTLVLMLGYVAYFVLAHDVMQRPAHWMQDKIGGRRWNLIVVSIALPMLLVTCAWLARGLRRHPRARLGWIYIGITLFLATVSFHTLLQVNIEIIHFPQYLILAVLLFALTRSFMDTMILGSLIGVIDEGWQYFYLHAHWGTYLDFNDIVLNAIGVGMGLTAIFILRPGPRPRAGRKIVLVGLVLAGAGLVLVASGAIRMTQSRDPASRAIELRRCPASKTFWHTTDWGKTYHIVEPEWGLAVTAAMVLFYGSLGRFNRGLSGAICFGDKESEVAPAVSPSS